jgi:hypothetical protein
MRLLRAVLGFGISFSFAWVIIFTFMQDPFRTAVSAQLFAYQTPPIAIYWYVLGAFAAGLLGGTVVAVLTWLRLTAQMRRSVEAARAEGRQMAILDVPSASPGQPLRSSAETTEAAAHAPAAETIEQ